MVVHAPLRCITPHVLRAYQSIIFILRADKNVCNLQGPRRALSMMKKKSVNSLSVLHLKTLQHFIPSTTICDKRKPPGRRRGSYARMKVVTVLSRDMNTCKDTRRTTREVISLVIDAGLISNFLTCWTAISLVMNRKTPREPH